MNFKLRYAFLFPGVNSRVELVPSHGALRRWLGDKCKMEDETPMYKEELLRLVAEKKLNILRNISRTQWTKR